MVQQVGYRETSVVTDPDTGAKTVVTSNETIHALGDPTDSEVVKRYYQGQNPQPYEIVRNSYYLGKFEAGKDYEIFLRTEDSGLWSNADWAGRYLVATDKLMAAYLAESFGPITDSNIYTLSQAYMPLAQVNGISFGMQSVAVGSPLPGGLPIALIAGLFGLGFWYFRRRKASVA